MYKTILKRTSIRSYSKQCIPKQKLQLLLQEINKVLQHPNPFTDAPIRIEYVPKSLPTYGFISGTNEFLVLIGPKFEAGKHSCQLALAKGGYLMEFVILFATALDIGTCWVGGTYLNSAVVSSLKQFDAEKESIIAISPIGMKGETRFFESMVKFFVKNRTRNPREKLFFDSEYNKPLKIPKEYEQAFEAVRWAPSAKNMQPWNIIYADNAFHFYTNPTNTFYTHIDIGIGMCHWEVICKENLLIGKWVHKDPKIDVPSGTKYYMTWVPNDKK